MNNVTAENSSDGEPIENGNQARILLREYKGRKAIIKTVLHPNLPLISRFETWMLNREGRALERLNTVRGVPDYLGKPDSQSIAMEYCPGETLRQADSGKLTEDFFDTLEKIVLKIHERGIVHADLKRKENVLATESGNPVIIDFGTHFMRKNTLRPGHEFLYDQFRQMDLNAVSKLKADFCPEAVGETDRRRLSTPTVLERVDRFRRNYVWDW